MASIAEFEQACENGASIQEELLGGILRKTHYLQKFGSPQSLAAYKSQVPIVSYEDVAGVIEKIACGEEDFPELGSGRVLGLYYCGHQSHTKAGIWVGALTTYLIKTYRGPFNKFTTPYEMIISGSNWRELTYCHLLCALIQRDAVEQIDASFAYIISEALKILQSDWQDICKDIRTGSLSSGKVTHPKLQEAFATFLVNKENIAGTADAIAKICSRESWSGILSLLFPGAKLVSAVVTGAMAHFVPELRDYAGGKLPISGKDYYSSEGVLGINTNPASPLEDVVFTILPHIMYYEFLPLGANNPAGEILAPHEVVVGQEYEIVITNFAGLYRYRVGDVVKVSSFFHGVPQLAFSHRKNAVLSVQNEMVDEQELQNVVMEVSKDAGIQVANFIAYGNSTAVRAHYVIFWELKRREGINRELLERCCSSIDRSFNPGYTGKRLDGVIDSLELVIVKEGTFERLMEEAVRNGTSPAQYKTPRCVTSPRMLEILESRRAESYKSGEMPSSVLESWEPSFPQGRQKN
ncbi:putative indole-3-acetic acid-amido synthetase GH3.9 [Selaginella moellendorffii]|uniref:putative indole-3-acetic acid-amido synthetase GH3.9 n=1 Tax=Selaginella moellendorffii TaxID=88036 RepID=UPI000D1CA288|nr:putative indole-3-acetic acid-amido synthetase GH3.9 [Selaginella moellendorffii]|eukprot:XP_002961747.2 putative indole-3-acetic acid-amido synthetase GH3.9 [Selaginella moellendorffii]